MSNLFWGNPLNGGVHRIFKAAVGYTFVEERGDDDSLSLSLARTVSNSNKQLLRAFAEQQSLLVNFLVAACVPGYCRRPRATTLAHDEQ